MKPYVVRQGDYLAKLAYTHGFDVMDVWQHVKNEQLRTLRADPNILYPGDILYIPTQRTSPNAVAKQASQTYVAAVPTVRVSVELVEDERVLANERCEVSGLPGTAADNPMHCTTDGEGLLSLDVPVTAREVEVYVPAQHTTYQLMVGDMDPENEASGLAKRLRNLDYLEDDLHVIEDEPPPSHPEVHFAEALEEAVAAFRQQHGHTANSAIDDAVRDTIVKEHGS